MLNETKERVLDLLQKGAPLTFIMSDCGLKAHEVVAISLTKTNAPKRHKDPKETSGLATGRTHGKAKVADKQPVPAPTADNHKQHSPARRSRGCKTVAK